MKPFAITLTLFALTLLAIMPVDAYQVITLSPNPPGGMPAATPAPPSASPAIKPTPRATPAGPHPRIVFDSEAKKLPPAREGELVRFSFRVSNAGDSALLLTRAAGSCGCTSVSLGVMTLMPGAATDLIGTFETAGRPGPQSKSIVISSNDPVRPEATIGFSIDVQALLEVEPKYINFGQAYSDETVTKTLTITSRSGEPLKLTNLSVEHPDHLRVALAPSSPTSPTQQRINVTLAPGLAPQALSGFVTAETNVPHQPLLRIALVGQIQSDITANPQVCWLGRVKAGDHVTRTLTLKDRHNRPIKVSGIDAHGLETTYQAAPPAADGSAQITLNFVIPAITGDVMQRPLDIITDDPKQPRFTVQVFAQLGVPPPTPTPGAKTGAAPSASVNAIPRPAPANSGPVAAPRRK